MFARLLAVLLFVSACEDETNALHLTSFVLQSAEGLVPRANTTVKVTFLHNRIIAGTGCQPVEGTYRFQDGVLQVDALWDFGDQRPDHCGELVAQHEAVVAFLQSRPALKLEGEWLTLQSASTTWRLRDAWALEPDALRADTSWAIDTVFVGSSMARARVNAPSVILWIDESSLGPTERLVLNVVGSCDYGAATVTWADDTLQLANPRLRGEACGGEDAALRDHVWNLLREPALKVHVDGDRLTLRGPTVGVGARALCGAKHYCE